MAVRNKKPTCTNCPRAKPVAKKVAEPIVVPPDIEMAQGLRLWNHVLFGTGTCIDMIAGYVRGNMPGNPREGITHLRDRLNQILNTLDAKNVAPDSAAK